MAVTNTKLINQTQQEQKIYALWDYGYMCPFIPNFSVRLKC